MQASPTTSARNDRYGHYQGAMRKGDGVRTLVSRTIFNEQVSSRSAGPDAPARAARQPSDLNALPTPSSLTRTYP